MCEKSRYQRSCKARSPHLMTSCKSPPSIIRSLCTGRRRPTRAAAKAVTHKSAADWPRRQEFLTGVGRAKTSPITAERSDLATSLQHSKTWWWKQPMAWNIRSTNSAHRRSISNNWCRNSLRWWPPRKSARPFTQLLAKRRRAVSCSHSWARAHNLRQSE